MSEILLVSGNPHRRKKGKHRRKSRHAKRYFRRASRNPSLRSIGAGFMPTIKAGFVGGAGGVANDILFGFAAPKLPAMLTTGIVRHAVKLGGAVLVGFVGSYFLKGKGAALAAGAASCAVRDAVREQLATAFPTLPLGDYDPSLLGYEDSAQHVGEYMGDFAQVGVGEYMPG